MPEDPVKLNYWIAAVAVDDLSLVPLQVAMHIGGLVHKATVHTIAFKRTPLYPASEMPRQPKKYSRPQPPLSSSSSSDDFTAMDHEPIVMSCRVLRELCRGKTADSLPPELRQFATLEVISMDDPHIDTQPQAARDPASQNQETQSTDLPKQLEFVLTADQQGQPQNASNVAGPLQDTEATRFITPPHGRVNPRPPTHSEPSRSRGSARRTREEKGKGIMPPLDADVSKGNNEPPHSRPHRSYSPLINGFTASPYGDSSGSKSGAQTNRRQSTRGGRVSSARGRPRISVSPRNTSRGHVAGSHQDRPLRILTREKEQPWADNGPSSLDLTLQAFKT